MKILLVMAITFVAILMNYHQVAATDEEMNAAPVKSTQNRASAVFAGGCFWCTESDFEKVDGVVEVISGYTGGHVANPTYRQVSAGGSGHVEAVKVIYDPSIITYEELLDIFWRHVDPTDAGGQFADRGAQYRSVIFYSSERERELAETSKKNLEKSGIFKAPIVTEIAPLETFYRAEPYHQDYYKKNPIRYYWYRSGSGRDEFLQKTWSNELADQAASEGGKN